MLLKYALQHGMGGCAWCGRSKFTIWGTSDRDVSRASLSRSRSRLALAVALARYTVDACGRVVRRVGVRWPLLRPPAPRAMAVARTQDSHAFEGLRNRACGMYL